MTRFPLSDQAYTLKDGEYILFDYNRELHYIYQDKEIQDATNRIVIKIHYAMMPTFIPKPALQYCKYVNHTYNTSARNAFLQTQKPKTLFEHGLGIFVMGTTYAYGYFVLYVDWFNFISLVTLILIAAYHRKTQTTLTALIIVSSIVVYLLYMTEYIHRAIPQATFIRDALFWKFVSWGLLISLYITYPINLISAGVATLGLLLSGSAFLKLGAHRTYFGQELQVHSESKNENENPLIRVTGFPYNLVPHPMIVGSWIFFFGLAVNNRFRKDFAYLLIIHAVSYAIVLLLELSDFNLRHIPFDKFKEEFKQYHRKQGNILAHVGTTALIYLGLFGWILKYIPFFQKAWLVIAACIFFLSKIFFHYSISRKDIAYWSSLFLAVVFCLARWISTSFKSWPWWIWAGIILIGLLLQEWSHYVYNEKTLLWNYDRDGSNKFPFGKYIMHTIWLIPFVISALFNF